MQQYLDHLQLILEKGTDKGEAREGLLPTKSLFGHQWRHNLVDGFPLLTTKKMFWKGIVVELLWFLRGDTNVKFLNDNGVTFWNEDAYNYYIKLCKKSKKFVMDIDINDNGPDGLYPISFKEFEEEIKNPKGLLSALEEYDYKWGDCGKQYGWLWRNWNTTEDQFKNLIEGLIDNPMGRRHIINAWNPATLDDMALHPCHCLVQFNCRPLSAQERINWYNYAAVADYHMDRSNVPRYYLDCQMYQRSADMFLGVPLNIASYALLTHLICKMLGMEPGEMIYSYGDSHIYGNVREEVNLQLTRKRKKLPELVLSKFISKENLFLREKLKTGKEKLTIDTLNHFIEALSFDDFKLENYNPYPKIDGKNKLLTGAKK